MLDFQDISFIRKSIDHAPGRIFGDGPVSVIDIGSNSVRIVVYERFARSPTSLYNEKVLAGLGRGLGESGVLRPDSIEIALSSIQRFRHLSQQLGAGRIFVFATAATRDANNGSEFIAKVEEICGVKVTVLSGRKEAYYTAMGVISGFQNPDGIAGDMGGGSLELVELDQSKIGNGRTFSLGGIRLQEDSNSDPKSGYQLALNLLADCDWLKKKKGKPFYAIGGNWRALARLHIFHTNYPLRVTHGYAIPVKACMDFCQQLIGESDNLIDSCDAIASARRQLLPYGAAVLAAVIEHSKPSEIVFSALGVREGLLYDNLSTEEKSKDPLLEAAWELAYLRSRSPAHSIELSKWMNYIFEELGIEETKDEKRLRAVACLLSDIGWRAHPDYRGEQSLNIISNAGFIGIDHPARIYLGLTAFFHHQGLDEDGLGEQIKALTTERMLFHAKLLGSAMRFAHHLTGNMPNVILKTKIKKSGDQIVLKLPPILADLDGERVQKRFNQFARMLNCNGEIKAEKE